MPATLEVFATHFPRFPVLPGVLILGDLVRVAALFAERETGGAWVAAAVEQVRWRRYVRPGDRMEVSVKAVLSTPAEYVVSGRVTVDGQAVTTIGAIRLRGQRSAVPALDSREGKRDTADAAPAAGGG